MSIDQNQMKASLLEMSASGFISNLAVLKKVSPVFEKDANGKMTANFSIVRYTCVDVNNFSTFVVKVNSSNLVISQEDLDIAKDPVYVEIPVEETVIKPYEIRFGKAKVSIIAPYLKIAEN